MTDLVQKLVALISEAPHYFAPQHDFDGKKAEWFNAQRAALSEAKAGGWQDVKDCPDGDVWFALSCGHVVMGWKQGPLVLDWEASIDHDCCYDASAIKAMPVTPPAHHGITAPAGGEG